jgi:hypothetical protein
LKFFRLGFWAQLPSQCKILGAIESIFKKNQHIMSSLGFKYTHGIRSDLTVSNHGGLIELISGGILKENPLTTTTIFVVPEIETLARYPCSLLCY